MVDCTLKASTVFEVVQPISQELTASKKSGSQREPRKTAIEFRNYGVD